ncbi:MAG: anti-sigma factor family protein [Burkholderiaceae bacterium]
MTCPKHDDLSAYADNRMRSGESERFAGHLAGCPICRRRLDELNALRQSLRELPSPALGFDLAARLKDRLRAAPVCRPARSFWPDWGPPAGLAVAALISGVWLGGLLIGGGAVSAPPAAMARVFDPVPPGGLCAAAELCRLSKGMQ